MGEGIAVPQTATPGTARPPNPPEQAGFIGTGAGLPQFLGIPSENRNGVMSANELLTRINLNAGRYWLFGDAKVGDKRLMWHELVDLQGDRSVTLDLRNARPVE